MKARPLKLINDGRATKVTCTPEEATHLLFKIPDRKGFFGSNILPVQLKGTRAGTGNWTWNGDCEKPTLKPSLVLAIGSDTKCHTWITDGKVQFLADSTHELSGTTVDLEDVEF